MRLKTTETALLAASLALCTGAALAIPTGLTTWLVCSLCWNIEAVLLLSLPFAKGYRVVWRPDGEGGGEEAPGNLLEFRKAAGSIMTETAKQAFARIHGIMEDYGDDEGAYHVALGVFITGWCARGEAARQEIGDYIDEITSEGAWRGETFAKLMCEPLQEARTRISQGGM